MTLVWPKMQWPLLMRSGFAVMLLVGCGSRVDRGSDLAGLRSLHVTPLISSSLTDAGARLDPAIREAVAHSLASRGYFVGSEADAQGLVRIAWILGREIGPDGREERTLSLSLSIFSRSGDRLYSARSAQNWPERMWSEDRAVTEVAHMLGEVPECHPSTVPVEGKPALAPIRLK